MSHQIITTTEADAQGVPFRGPLTIIDTVQGPHLVGGLQALDGYPSPPDNDPAPGWPGAAVAFALHEEAP